MATAIHGRRATGPFIVPARVILGFSGVLAIVTGLIHLVEEIEQGETGFGLAAVFVVLSQVWLFSLFFAWRGNRLAIAIAGLLAFGEFANQASSHFAIGVNAIEFVVPVRGLGFAIDLLILEVACLICAVSAFVCISNPFGWKRSLRSFPFLLVALVGVSALLLHAADDIGRRGFGSLSVEDGLMLTVLAAAIWLLGALWMADSLIGAFLVLASTLYAVVSFVVLHLPPGGVSVLQIDQQSGHGAAVIAAASGVLAGASLVGVTVWILERLIPTARRRLEARGKRRQAEARTKTR